MKFSDSLLSGILNIPINGFRDNDLYHFILQAPYYVLLYLVGIPLAIVVDIFHAMGKLPD